MLSFLLAPILVEIVFVTVATAMAVRFGDALCVVYDRAEYQSDYRKIRVDQSNVGGPHQQQQDPDDGEDRVDGTEREIGGDCHKSWLLQYQKVPKMKFAKVGCLGWYHRRYDVGALLFCVSTC
jgi:hypothetical protein